MRTFSTIALFLISLVSVGQPVAQNYTFPDATVYTAEGKSVKSGDWDNEGKPILVFTWAYKWCQPCVERLDEFAKVYNEWVNKTGVKLIALNQDSEYSLEAISDYVRKKDWPFEVYYDRSRDFMEKSGVESAPLSLFLNKRKQTVRSYLSYSVNADLFLGILLNIDQSPQYFDDAWEFTAKENALYYRIVERDYNNLEAPFIVKDYYMDNTLQMIGHYARIYPQEIGQGEIKRYRQDGTLESVSNEKDGLYQGIRTQYHQNEQIWSELEYKDGKPWKAISNYDENGKPKDMGTLKKGKGTLISYQKNGMLSSIRSYNEGLINGSVKNYYTGNEPQIAEELNYKNGQLHGMQIYYYSNGQVSSRIYYTDGLRDGEVTTYHMNGIKKGQASFSKGSLTREIVYWDSLGYKATDYVDKALAEVNFQDFLDQIDYEKYDPGEEEAALIYYVYNEIAKSEYERFYESMGIEDYSNTAFYICESENFRELYSTLIKFILIEYMEPLSSNSNNAVNTLKEKLNGLLLNRQVDQEELKDALDEILFEDLGDLVEDDDQYEAAYYVLLLHLFEKESHPMLIKILQTLL